MFLKITVRVGLTIAYKYEILPTMYRTDKLPKTIEILGYTLKVEEVDKFENENHLGLCLITDHCLRVLKSLPQQEKWATLYHEIAHFVIWKMTSSDKDQMTEEDICKLFEAFATLKTCEA